MRRNALLAVLAGLVLVQLGTFLLRLGAEPSPISDAMWIGFLVLIPVGLAVVVGLRLRGAAMACVIYGTVGLALDLATVVQILTAQADRSSSLVTSGISGVLNFLVVAIAGQAFLDVAQAPAPPGVRPPNPPSFP
ncbi:putative Membrane protein [Nitrospira moscoviensis]|uniref:Putative Membrane protein n=2 Tax=Nitrospira moscoviensis TaxID=42253 RepID=A0A0K2G9V4_NITMO|nr:putative Membrane protein [Nitrospira moscoviensis]